MTEEKNKGPLAGLRILDLGTMIAGPVAATLLGDLGAEVIKLEQPGLGDTLRHVGPFADGESLYWNVEGRGKKSITIDLRQEAGQALLRELVKHADALVENFRPGTLKKWNVDYDNLREVNPRLVMLSISGYGQTGPYASRAGYDRIALAFSGLLNMTGYPDRPPVRPGTAIADYQSALFGAFATMVALYNRDAMGGVGQQIDMSLYEASFRFTDIMVTAYDKLGMSRERRGNIHFAAEPGDHFETIDGRYIVLTVSSNSMFKRVCETIGRPELVEDPRFVSHVDRHENVDEINAIVGEWVRSRPVAEICAILDDNGLAYSLVFTVKDIVADPHYAARGSIATLDHSRLGPLKMPAVSPLFSETPPPPLTQAPTLGADTDEVLSTLLGLSASEIIQLRDGRVI